MNSFKGTPGPWHVNAIDSKRGRIVGDETSKETWDKLHVNGENSTVARVFHGHNARLIASAPDLLAALEAMRWLAEEGYANIESDVKHGVEGASEALENAKATLEAARAAIAKALGN